jgi:hypothetical protein
MKVLHDDFGNTATIKEEMHFPYRGAKEKQNAFILTLTADYENNCIYFVSYYESMLDAMNKLKNFSCIYLPQCL